MNPQLSEQLSRLRRRAIAVAVAGGVGWAIIAALVLVVLFCWADLVAELSPGMRVLADWAVIIVLSGISAWTLFKVLDSATPQTMAKRADEVAGGRGQILSGVDLAMTKTSGVGVGA